jgi:hypothetical protein
MNNSEIMNLITHSELKLNLKGTQGKLNDSAFTKMSMQLFYIDCRQIALTLKFAVINFHGGLIEVRNTLLAGLIPIHRFS